MAAIENLVSRLPDQPGLCLHYAHHTASVLKHCGFRPAIQAGSLQWPRIRPEEDDGEISTHFAYMWSPQTSESMLSVTMGNLPEMHVCVSWPGMRWWPSALAT